MTWKCYKNKYNIVIFSLCIPDCYKFQIWHRARFWQIKYNFGLHPKNLRVNKFKMAAKMAAIKKWEFQNFTNKSHKESCNTSFVVFSCHETVLGVCFVQRLTTHNTRPIDLHVLWPIRSGLPALLKWGNVNNPIYHLNHCAVLLQNKK